VTREQNVPPSATDAAIKAEETHVPAEPLTAVVVGATGLVGARLLHELFRVEEYGKIRALVRRPLEPHGKLDARVVDFERPATWDDALDAQHVFCTAARASAAPRHCSWSARWDPTRTRSCSTTA
jgi:hypothetical protein